MLRLDLGCGPVAREGYAGVDLNAELGPAHVVDLFMNPWPFEDSSVEAVWCSHFVEHVPDLVAFMNELWRVCAPGAEVEIVHPYQFSVRAWQDPTHRRAINERTWQYFSAKGRTELLGLEGYGSIVADFEVAQLDFVLSEEWSSRPVDEQWRAIRNYVNVVDDLHLTLVALKADSGDVEGGAE